MTNEKDVSKNIVLVGASGVGKTTLGRAAAIRLGMPFFDGDEAFEVAEGLKIDDLLSKYGEKGYDRRLLDFFLSALKSTPRTILATPGRLTHYKPFWEGVRKASTSIHLRGSPMEIYWRSSISVGGVSLTDEEKDDEYRIREFAAYHRWRVRHCGKADYTLRIVGQLQKDLDGLCELISQIQN